MQRCDKEGEGQRKPRQKQVGGGRTRTHREESWGNAHGIENTMQRQRGDARNEKVKCRCEWNGSTASKNTTVTDITSGRGKGKDRVPAGTTSQAKTARDNGNS